MESLLEHVRVATTMYKNKLNLKFIKEFKIKEIEDCCTQLENLHVDNKIYESSEIIERELIKDANSINYLIKIFREGIDPIKIKDLVEIIQENKEKITNYEVENIIKVLKDNKLYCNTSYAYLKYFINNIKSDIGRKTVIANLEYFFTQDDVKLNDLDEDEINLFTSPFLSDYNLIPKNNIKRVYELLVQNEELKKLILFLYINKLTIPLNIRQYEKLNIDSKKIHEYLSKIIKAVDNDTMYRLLLKWSNNGCSIYDLKIIDSKIKDLEPSKLENIVANRSGYINFIFGNKICNLKLDSINESKEGLLIYAISNNKKGFLKLIEQNQEEFLQIPAASILYDENFYLKYVNINDLNIKNLKELKFMNNKNYYINSLKEKIYTFNEIKALYEASNENYYIIYNYLSDMKIDEKILRIKQLINKNLISSSLSFNEMEKLAEKLKEKSLYNWIEQDFKDIKGLTPKNAIDALINYSYISKFISEIKNRNELLYLLRNKDIINTFSCLESIRDNIESIDKYWNELINLMDISQEFIKKYKENIKTFLLNNGAELALAYYKECYSDREKASYKLIVKSELMGEFKRLKYYTNDLEKEICYELNDSQIKEWTNNNLSFSCENIEVSEYDDFYHTMILGEEPMHTCLSYRNGAYNSCLLACFDSNKKILYAKIDGKIVARAMVRLTKGSYQNKNEIESLSFVDLENIEEKDKSKKINEKLTIFLEKAYIAGISDTVEKKVEKMFIEVLERKAKKMNALLVLSNYYYLENLKDYISTRYYMYISKSKAGAQYLDSLRGQATVSDEGQYRENNFLIWKPDEK